MCVYACVYVCVFPTPYITFLVLPLGNEVGHKNDDNHINRALHLSKYLCELPNLILKTMSYICQQTEALRS